MYDVISDAGIICRTHSC